jgi:hypothetical protein
MKMPRFVLSILLTAVLISGCSTGAANDLEKYTMPTVTPADDSLTETVQSKNTASSPPSSCPVTVPQDPPFVPPSPYDRLGFDGEFWYGSNSLWTAVRQNGTWEALPHNPEGYTQKVFWWREGYSAGQEPEPELAVTAERLDAQAPSIQGSKATNASASDIGSAMLVGVDLPTLGCWKITGKYGDTELSFVVWVAP